MSTVLSLSTPSTRWYAYVAHTKRVQWWFRFDRMWRHVGEEAIARHAAAQGRSWTWRQS